MNFIAQERKENSGGTKLDYVYKSECKTMHDIGIMVQENNIEYILRERESIRNQFEYSDRIFNVKLCLNSFFLLLLLFSSYYQISFR